MVYMQSFYRHSKRERVKGEVIGCERDKSLND